MEQWYRHLKEKNYHLIFIAGILGGVCVHGSRIFTAYYGHDDITMIGVGTTYTSGRWFLQALYKLQMLIMGSSINAKGFMGMTVILLMTVICLIIACGLGFRSKKSSLLLSCIVITFPYVASLLSYTYTAPHYCISLIMALSGAILAQSGQNIRQKIFRTLCGIVLLGLSMAIYQTTLCVFVAFLVLLAVKNSFEKESETWGAFLARCLRYLLSCIGGCVFYYVSNNAVLRYKGFSMSGYQNIDHMAEFTVPQMINRVLFAYREFFYPASAENYSFYCTTPIRWAYWLTLLTLGICGIIFLVREIKKGNIRKALQLLILFCVIPPAVNSVFLTADVEQTNIYSLMMFADVMIYVCLIDALERLNWANAHETASRMEKKNKNTMVSSLTKAGASAAVVLLLYVSVYFAYTVNICYARAAVQQEQTIGYFNRLITRIQMTEGYSADMKIAYINDWGKNEEAMSLRYLFNEDGYRIAAYNYSSLINMYNWKEYMDMWCGFRAPEVSAEVANEYKAMPEVQQMPCYPYDGSLKVIDGVLVIKFAE